ncbi:MAG TPA: BACON domain-containing carbohydrate-binding protein [Blastocatellia bacterium]|nr:BACON domain-containing carbohydrate-binding protein [Blastocatellia bacterium]
MNRARLLAVVCLTLIVTFASGLFDLSRAADSSKPLPRSTAVTAVSVLTHHNDRQRSGANLLETTLSPDNVNVNQFGKLFTRTVSGYVYAQPLVAAGVSVPGVGARNVVYVATESNNVYAFDADDSDAVAPYWQVNLGTPMPSGDIFPGYHDLTPEIGITSTPVIDPATNTIYVVAKTKDAPDGTYHHRLHALDLATGSEKFGGPAEINASVLGSGSGGSGGTVNFDHLHQLNRPGLLLLNNVVYIAFGSHGDADPYHGWVLGYDATTLQQVAVFNTTPDGAEAAIWQGGQGLAADTSGNIYLVTGNGTFDVDTGGRNYGNAVVKLSTANGLSVADWFVPYNVDQLRVQKATKAGKKTDGPRNMYDIDLGAGGPLLLPGTNLLLIVGKDHVLRLFDCNNLGNYFSDHNANLQEFSAASFIFMGAPIYGNGQIYLWGAGDTLKAYALTGGLFETKPSSQSTFNSVFGYSNSSPLSLSANGTQAGIIWALCSAGGDANGQTVPGILRAFDATDLSRELWNSQQNVARDDIGSFAKFNPPTIANGKVYVPTFSGQLHVFGLLPALDPLGAAFEASGDEGRIQITAPAGIHWTAQTSDNWIVIKSPSGVGDGEVTYVVRDNFSGSPRAGTISIAGQTFLIQQAGDAAINCTCTLAPAYMAFGVQGGSGQINLTTESHCSWEADSSVSWITITSGCCGIGSGQITYTVAENTGTTTRKGVITVGGESFAVKQTGKPSN